MKLIYLNNTIGQFKMRAVDTREYEDIPNTFVDKCGSDMQKYKEIQMKIRELNHESVKLLNKLKVSFEKEFRETNPEYFL